MENQPIIEVQGLNKEFIVNGKKRGQKKTVHAVNNVSFSMKRGTTLAVVGESGSGKTTLAKMIMRFEPITAGKILFNGNDISQIKGKDALKAFRKQIQMVHQDPTSSLNPSKTIREIIEEPLLVHRYGDSKARLEKVKELIQIVELPIDFLERYPHMLSGGQKQRVGIARAIALDSELIILDEPTSALDVSVQAKIIQLLENLQEKYHLSYLFITHDLALVKNFSNNVIVMQLGNLVEQGSVEEIFHHAKEVYTKKLLKSIPVVEPAEQAYLDSIVI
ncbi:ABC transporter ATP-binding protein [Enterococcus saccharolyticus]|uniref:ATP-binding cassette domain-containing protein n=1 Tax=Enterococcus TaxID=1350 RepID=UPI00137A6915|nr:MULTISPECIES: ATP-binding cassette domain-containing protein [Enterococcus]MCD5001666.1 ABC transporter ATP-binding protein [Enterococcus saccharolyticus]